MTSPTAAPAGWYPDPSEPSRQLYWDGQAWTGHVAQLDQLGADAAAAPVVAAPAAAAPAAAGAPRSARRDTTQANTAPPFYRRRGVVIGIAIAILVIAIAVIALHSSGGTGTAASSDGATLRPTSGSTAKHATPPAHSAAPITLDSTKFAGQTAQQIATALGCTDVAAHNGGLTQSAVSCTYQGKPILIATFANTANRNYWGEANVTLNAANYRGRVLFIGNVAIVAPNDATAQALKSAVAS